VPFVRVLQGERAGSGESSRSCSRASVPFGLPGAIPWGGRSITIEATPMVSAETRDASIHAVLRQFMRPDLPVCAAAADRRTPGTLDAAVNRTDPSGWALRPDGVQSPLRKKLRERSFDARFRIRALEWNTDSSKAPPRRESLSLAVCRRSGTAADDRMPVRVAAFRSTTAPAAWQSTPIIGFEIGPTCRRPASAAIGSAVNW